MNNSKCALSLVIMIISALASFCLPLATIGPDSGFSDFNCENAYLCASKCQPKNKI